jgi:hypothetical protein
MGQVTKIGQSEPGMREREIEPCSGQQEKPFKGRKEGWDVKEKNGKPGPFMGPLPVRIQTSYYLSFVTSVLMIEAV